MNKITTCLLPRSGQCDHLVVNDWRLTGARNRSMPHLLETASREFGYWSEITQDWRRKPNLNSVLSRVSQLFLCGSRFKPVSLHTGHIKHNKSTFIVTVFIICCIQRSRAFVDMYRYIIHITYRGVNFVRASDKFKEFFSNK